MRTSGCAWLGMRAHVLAGAHSPDARPSGAMTVYHVLARLQHRKSGLQRTTDPARSLIAVEPPGVVAVSQELQASSLKHRALSPTIRANLSWETNASDAHSH